MNFYVIILKSFLLTISQMTTGAPIMDVMALMGRALSKPGIRAMMLQTSASNAPVKIVPGKMTLWLEVWNRLRVRCGTASPRNAIGPQ